MTNTPELIAEAVKSMEEILEHEVLLIEALDEAIAKLIDFKEKLDEG